MNAILKSAFALSASMLIAGSAMASGAVAAPPASDLAPAGEVESKADDRQLDLPGDSDADMKVKICCGTAGDYGVICWRC